MFFFFLPYNVHCSIKDDLDGVCLDMDWFSSELFLLEGLIFCFVLCWLYVACICRGLIIGFSLKLFLLHALYEWMAMLPNHRSSTLFACIHSCSCSWCCCSLSIFLVYWGSLLLIIQFLLYIRKKIWDA